jgi:hypothetical protein
VYTQATTYFDLDSTAHTHGQVANFTNTTFVKQELAVNTLREVKSVKALCPTHVLFKLVNPIKTWCN